MTLKSLEGQLYQGMIIRLYAHTLEMVCDSAFMNDRVETFRRRQKSLQKMPKLGGTFQHSIAHEISERSIDIFFRKLIRRETFEDGTLYDAEWYLSDLIETFSLLMTDGEFENHFMSRCEPFYAEFRTLKGRRKQMMYIELNAEQTCQAACVAWRKHRTYRIFRRIYALAIADRLFHDRQVSAFISEYLTNSLASYGKRGRVQIARSRYWPTHVKRLLYSRDRGKCACCGCDLLLELLGEAQVDHIVSLRNGGTNELVNLQLICKKCNLKKSAAVVEAKSSIPQYHGLVRRSRKRHSGGRARH